MKKKLSLAYSSCPNDTFIFKGIAQGLIDTKGLTFNIVLEDVETLNQKAVQGAYDITKLSFAALGKLLDTYALLGSGAALGQGCGPLIISLAGRSIDDRGGDGREGQRGGQRPGGQAPPPIEQVIAVPGLGTTAYHLFQFYMEDLFPDIKTAILPMAFEKIMPAVIQGRADFGVIIHEGRFVYQNMNLEMRADLGQWWEDKTRLPIPLGCIAVRRTMDRHLACQIQDLIQASIDHAFLHPHLGEAHIQDHAQEMDPLVIQQHIHLYVNEFSRDMGDLGRAAVHRFFDYACQAGLMPKLVLPLFACPRTSK